ncbi:type II toxin-antitoxin system RelE/ParE family toxin [Myxococcota bacterium]|nr:type II toxin-antitoxin system RelE/ParE family toxin [Myxococcota bacterium]
MGRPLYEVRVTDEARRQLRALPERGRREILAEILDLEIDPFPPHSTPMHSDWTGFHRMRVGIYRVIYRVREQVLEVLVVRVGHRSTVYQNRR